ncbi:MAG TPA: nucleotide disphospho-sugar-binding domain-containing protein [Streptosporangiaceae bacterium]
MRVLFIPAAVSSHHYPMVPLAWAFRVAGNEVCVAGQPPVIESIVRSGLPAVRVGETYDLFAGLADVGAMFLRETGLAPNGDLSAVPPTELRRLGELRVEPLLLAAEAMARDLVEFARFWRPDLVITDPITLAAPLVSEVMGVPLVHHLWGPQPPSLPALPGYGAGTDLWPDRLLSLYDAFGARARSSYGVGTVDPCPPSLQPAPVPHRIGVRYLCYNGSGIVPGWLRQSAGRPRVCVSWLTTRTVAAGTGTDHPAHAIIAALTDLDVEVVATLRAPDREALLGHVPAGVRLEADLPLHLVLPSCEVAVNHGGGGTVLTVACLGVPQVMVPQEPGQIFNAECITAAGAGDWFRPGPGDAGRVAVAVSSMLSDDTRRKAAHALREENLAQPTSAEAVEAIGRLI